MRKEKQISKMFICLLVLFIFGNIFPAYALKESASASATADFLYWVTDVDGLEYGVQTDPVGTTGGFQNSSIFSTKYDWDPGIRARLGWHSIETPWDVMLMYVYFKNEGKSFMGVGQNIVGGSFFRLLFFHPVNVVQEAISQVEFNYHVGDFELGRTVAPSEFLKYRALVGLRGAYLKQDLDVTFTNLPNFDPGLVQEKWDFWGGGIRFGIEGDWRIWETFGFIGKASFSTLITRNKFRGLINPNSTTTLMDLREKYFKITPMFDIQIGLQVATRKTDRGQIRLASGYELVHWWNVNQIERLSALNVGIENHDLDSLTIHGFFIRGGLDF